MNTERGFTLTELLATIAIAAILAAIAVPSFQDMVADSRVTTATNNLISNLSLARSEAIKRNVPVVLCRSTSSTAAAPACGGGAAQTWESGWFVYVNVDEDSPPTFDNLAGDIVLRIQEPLTGNLDLRSAVLNDTHIEFAADGTSNMVGGTSHFAVCDDRGAAEGRQVSVGILGRPELQKENDGKPLSPITSCTNPIDP